MPGQDDLTPAFLNFNFKINNYQTFAEIISAIKAITRTVHIPARIFKTLFVLFPSIFDNTANTNNPMAPPEEFIIRSVISDAPSANTNCKTS